MPEGADPGDANRDKAQAELVGEVAKVFNGELIELIDTIRRDKEQTVVHDDLDELVKAEWAGDTEENAQALTQEFADYLTEQADNIDALTIYFHTPARRSEVTFTQIKALARANQTRTPQTCTLARMASLRAPR